MVAYSEYPFDARVQREAETLSATDRFEVTVICLKSRDDGWPHRNNGVEVWELDASKYTGGSRLQYFLSYLRFLIKAFAACSWLLVGHGIDIVHVHNIPNLLVLAGILPRLFGRPVILDMHDSIPDLFASKFDGTKKAVFKALCVEEKMSSLLCDRIICVNEVQKRVIVQRGIPASKISVFMNVPDQRHFSAPVKSPESPDHDGRFRLVYHGTIEERLGIALAVEAVSEIRRQIPGVELHFWGGRPYWHSLSRQSQALGAGDIVHFHKAVPVDELARALVEMDVGVIPYKKTSATELALPVKMMEYIALGIPVVVPKLKAIEHYFTDEMVTYFQPENALSLIDAIVKVYSDRMARIARTSRAREFLALHGWHEQSVRFLRFYGNVLQRRLRRGRSLGGQE